MKNANIKAAQASSGFSRAKPRRFVGKRFLYSGDFWQSTERRTKCKRRFVTPKIEENL